MSACACAEHRRCIVDHADTGAVVVLLSAHQEFKIAALLGISTLFPPRARCFYAGFGNRDTDMVAYKEVGVPPGKIFLINSKVLRRSVSGVATSRCVVQLSLWLRRAPW